MPNNRQKRRARVGEIPKMKNKRRTNQKLKLKISTQLIIFIDKWFHNNECSELPKVS